MCAEDCYTSDGEIGLEVLAEVLDMIVSEAKKRNAIIKKRNFKNLPFAMRWGIVYHWIDRVIGYDPVDNDPRPELMKALSAYNMNDYAGAKAIFRQILAQEAIIVCPKSRECTPDTYQLWDKRTKRHTWGSRAMCTWEMMTYAERWHADHRGSHIHSVSNKMGRVNVCM